MGEFFVGVDVTDCIFPRRNISSNIQFAVLMMRGMDMMKSILNDFFDVLMQLMLCIENTLHYDETVMIL